MSKRTFRRSVPGVLAALLVCGSAVAQAASNTETFGRWTIQGDEVDTGEDLRKTCSASTSFVDAGGNSGTLSWDISNGDVLPPDGYPTLTIAVSNKGLPEGENIPAIFADSNGKIEATVYASGEAGGQWMMNNKTETSLALLRAMRRAGAIDVAFAGKPVATVSMDGFTKAYRRLGVMCGFPTGDVAP